ncbi:ATP-binding cassette domain-containing protein [Bartonella sp. HY329]|uniref:methionine ABC transporter ATP-binding protein n=1 Tax=unclassified Bartonella TaxID=2645622 RepID=UPI0021C815F9|nr:MULTISPECIES: ATP-binding cassette domain-containing protein [unclassified Bartonella]UXM94809.1 ATP-binding cassette domain-containing protein [Bartonella sp. HY329]UXN09132.1 ATP-binding cassette domain-containing protein [Bartonella sp. HY328]
MTLKTNPVLELKHIRRHFAQTAAVDDISLTVNKGEILGIIGRSGAGKSTLIRCFNGLETIDEGQIYFEGQDISKLKDDQWRKIRHKIGMIFQHFNLLSSKTVIENIALPLKLVGVERQKRLERALELLDLVGLADKADMYPVQLSGGQKQRVGIARALAGNPSILLSDEATSALDPETTQSILELLREINRKMQLTIILITHEMEVVRSIADRLIVLDQGKIVEQGLVKEIFARPQNATTKSLLQVITPQLPSMIADKMHESYGKDAIIELHISGEEARKPFFYNLADETGMVTRILQGGIDTIQDEPIGLFFIAADATDKKQLEHAIKWLKQRANHCEVLGYV